MLRFENYNHLTESALNKGELQKPAGKGPNAGILRAEIFADKISKGEEHLLNDGSSIVITKITMNGETYGKNDMDKFVTDFEDVESISISEPPTPWKNVAKTPEYGGEGGGQKISTSTQELMTAAIVLLGKKFDSSEIDVEDAKNIIEEAKGKWDSIVGVKGAEKLLNQFTDNWYDLATAVSSANAILKIVPNPTKVFWTGQKWDDEIAPFNPAIGNIKDYNSSDIVVAGGNRYYGFSLKKKKSSKDADPTLINKPITGNKSLLRDFISEKDYALIERAKNLFFIRMVAAYKKTTNYSAIQKMSEKEFKKEIAKIPNDFANDMLAGRGVSGRKNLFWMAVNKVLEKDSKELMIAFMKLIFKVDLQPILDESGQFDFYLLTGIGQRKKDKIGVEPAEVKDLPTTIEALTKIFKDDNIKLGKTVDKNGKVKRQPWEYSKDEKAPAKLFYTVYNGSTPLLNLEIRYKGSKTAEPQFQATATPIFKNMMKGVGLKEEVKSNASFLIEGKEGKNLHLEHIEDEILNFGVPGGRAAINFVRSLRDMLAGEARSSVNMTVKWDGAPAIFAGTDPSDGKFFVAKKSVFNVSPKLYKTNAEIDADLSGDLNAKFKVALAEFSKLGIKGVLQGDLMYTDLDTDTIDGTKYYTFQPNTIVYAVPVDSDLGKIMNASKIGVVWHTTYKGSTLQDMKASFGANISGLTKSKSVWMDDATYKDVSGKATMTSKETAEVTAHLSNAGKTFQRINAPSLKKILRLQDSLRGKLVGASYKTYNNTKVRAGQAVKDPKGHANGYVIHVENHFQKEIDKLKTQKSKDVLETKKTEYVREFKKMLPNLQQVTAFQMHLVNAKMGIVKKLNSVKGLTDTFIKTSNGFKVVNPEGYVAIDRVSGDAVKLVDRMEFSFNNFTAIKAWDK